MKLTTLLALCALILGTISSYGQTLEQVALCDTVANREAGTPKDMFKVGERAYCWMKVKDATVGDHLVVEWIRGEESIYTMKLNLKYTSMRTYCYKTLNEFGVYKVEIKKSDGTLLEAIKFNVRPNSG